jgi:hypothetical protein
MRPRRGLARRARAPRPALTTIALGWRKTARAHRRGVPARPGRLTARQYWSPHFHLHFDIRSASVRYTAPGRAARDKPATTILWRRIENRLAALLPVLRTTSTRDWRSIAHRVERSLLTRRHHHLETHRSEVVRLLRTAAMPPGSIRRPAPPESAAPILHRHLLAVAAPARRAAPLTLETRLPGRARRGAASPLGETERRPAVPGAPLRPPLLVWRSEAGERPAEVAERVAWAAAASVSPLPAGAAATQPSWPPAEALEALRPRLIDGALIDRVAEDVIGRVEKKIRIERERRGV